MPGRHSLFWKLAILLVTFCLLVISLSSSWVRRVEEATSFLSSDAQRTLQGYADEAERAWREEGAAGVDAFISRLSREHPGFIYVIDSHQHSLGSQPIADEHRARLSFLRRIDRPMSRRGGVILPVLEIPLQNTDARLVMRLPAQFRPWQNLALLQFVIGYLIPGLLALAFCAGLYRVLISPLVRLREQANALHADNLGARVGPPVTERRDELGELGRAFDHMAERLQRTVELQRQLLRDLSHELRTPLSRLRVACEKDGGVDELRLRVEQEIGSMQRLVDGTLELAWLDTERPHLPLEPVELLPLWELLTENASFESGFAADRLVFELDAECRVLGHLNSLAQALENLLRNAIRHSPEGAPIRLGGNRQGEHWKLWLEDQGGGVGADQLETIFLPFTRLDGARPGDGGFGLGLSIARSAIEAQQGRLWAENVPGGLRLNLLLRAANV